MLTVITYVIMFLGHITNSVTLQKNFNKINLQYIVDPGQNYTGKYLNKY